MVGAVTPAATWRATAAEIFERDVPRFIQVKTAKTLDIAVKLVKVSTFADDLTVVTLTQDQTQRANWLAKSENKQRF